MALTDSIVAYWRMDEVSGNRSDSVGSNTLVDSNTVTSATGKIGNASDFEADNSESLSIADNAAMSTGDIDFTFAGWVNMESAGFRTILSKESNSSVREYVLWYDSTGAVATNRFFWRVNKDGVGSGDVLADNYGELATGTWAFFVVWHDSVNNEVGIQINNGAPNTTSYSSGATDNAQPFTIGVEGTTGTRYWDGLIDSVGFWKRLLTADEKARLYNAGRGLAYPFTDPKELVSTPFISDSRLVSYYRMNTGALTTDSKGSNTLTNNNTVAEALGKFGIGASTGTANTNKSLSIASTLGLSSSASRAIMVWAKMNTELSGADSYGDFVTMTHADIDIIWRIGYWRESSVNKVIVNRGKNGVGTTPISTNTSLGIANYHLIGFNWNGTTLEGFLDGVSFGTDTPSGNGNNGLSDEFRIGADTANSNPISATMDEVAVFNNTLTAAEWLAIYNGSFPFGKSFMKLQAINRSNNF